MQTFLHHGSPAAPRSSPRLLRPHLVGHPHVRLVRLRNLPIPERLQLCSGQGGADPGERGEPQVLRCPAQEALEVGLGYATCAGGVGYEGVMKGPTPFRGWHARQPTQGGTEGEGGARLRPRLPTSPSNRCVRAHPPASYPTCLECPFDRYPNSVVLPTRTSPPSPPPPLNSAHRWG